MSRSLLRSVLGLTAPCARPPTAAAPALRASTRCLATTAGRREAVKTTPSAAVAATPASATTTAAAAATPSASGTTTTSPTGTPGQSVTPPSKPHAPSTGAATAATKMRPQAGPLTTLYPRVPQAAVPLATPEARESVAQLLPLLRAQPAHYIRAHIWGRPYLVTAGDEVRLPFKMPGVVAGDVLRLDRASALGSRDYTLTGAPYVDERLFECRATVLGAETEPLRVKVKTKRRQRRHKNVKSKLRFTVLRISELTVKGPEAVGL